MEKSKRRSKKELTKWIRKRIAANESIGRKDESRSWKRALAVLVRLHEDNVRLRGENERMKALLKTSDLLGRHNQWHTVLGFVRQARELLEEIGQAEDGE